MSEAINTPEGIKHLPKPNVKDSRVLMYLNMYEQEPLYQNTEEESILVEHWYTKYTMAKAEYMKSRCNDANVQKWRDAYEGRFYRLDENGEPTEKRMKPLRKIAFEMVESKVNARIPAPQMSPRYHHDIIPVRATENLIKHDMDRMLSEELNDEAERATLIDSTCWAFVGWNPFDNTHERSGMPEVRICPVDKVFPQPGITNYKKLEYIFEEQVLTVAQVRDMFGRNIYTPNYSDLVTMIFCYYLNEDRHVGRFVFEQEKRTVADNSLEWGMRRRRECLSCHEIVPIEAECPKCHSRVIDWVPVKKVKLDKPLDFVANPYRSGESADQKDDETNATEQVPADTWIPHYLIRQLPYVPKRNYKVPGSMYGISEVELCFENQDSTNKLLNKAEAKSAGSKTWIQTDRDSAIKEDEDEVGAVYKYVESDDLNKSKMVVTQVMADMTGELAMAEMNYSNIKSTSGITDTDQGKSDPNARSGKQAELKLMASAERKQSPNKQREAFYAGVFELIFKNLLAYSDEERSYVALLPDGTEKEELWSRYMFLSRDDSGEFYYRDDFAWSVDSAVEITQDRAAMWQRIDNDYLSGVMGNEVDPFAALQMYWHMKDQAGYPTAKFALAFLKERVKTLPNQVQQALTAHPEAVELALSFIADTNKANGLDGGSGGSTTGQGSGGARANSGPQGNGGTQRGNIEKTNMTNRARQGQQTNTHAAARGGMQGGTQGVRK